MTDTPAMAPPNVPTSPVYRLDTSSELNQPWYHYTLGGQGMHAGLDEDHRYAAIARVAWTHTYIFVNLTTGQVVTGAQPLSRFKVEEPVLREPPGS